MPQTVNEVQAPSFASRFRWMPHITGPRQIYNRRLYLSIFVFGMLGAARGLDEGNISANMGQASFRKQFKVDDPNKSRAQLAYLQSNIALMVQLGSIGGAAAAAYTVEKLGRLNALRLVCVVWAAGVVVQITSSAVGQLYAGRVIEGLAVGHATTIGPTYLTEVAPTAIRGLCGSIFAGAVYFGVMLSYFANYGTALHISDHSRCQWVVPTCVKIIFAGIIFFMSLVVGIESPKWLMRAGRPHEAAVSLTRLRGLDAHHEYMERELEEMKEAVSVEHRAKQGTTVVGIFRELFSTKPNQYRMVVLGLTAQMLGQWGGANAVTIYAPELFATIGIRGKEKLKYTAVLGVVKFVSAYASAFFIIDVLGRRCAVYAGLSIQLACELYYAVFLSVIPLGAGDRGKESAGASSAQEPLSGGSQRAARGALAAIFVSGTGWCIGFNNIQYLLGSEIFPLGQRPVANSIIMVFHYANQYGNSKALPKMMLAMKPYGAFYFFLGVLFVLLMWVWFFVPEVAGLSADKMERLFSLPWRLIGRKGAGLVKNGDVHYDVHGDRVLHSGESDSPMDKQVKQGYE